MIHVLERTNGFRIGAGLWGIALLLCWMGSGAVQAQETFDVRSLKKEAKKGDARALFRLGLYHELQKKNARRAFGYYEQSAKKRYDSAYLALGRLYEAGQGTSKAPKKAFRAYNDALKASSRERRQNIPAMMALGRMHSAGIGTAKDPEKGSLYYLMAHYYGSAEADSLLAKLPLDKLIGNPDTLFYAAYQAEQGDSAAQYRMAYQYERGSRTASRDYQKALRLYKKSAEKGYPAAFTGLGRMYAGGKLVPRNDRLAAQNYMKGAILGDTAAVDSLRRYDVRNLIDPGSPTYMLYKARTGAPIYQYKMYERYRYGRGVARNERLALEFCQRAALQQNPRAMLELAQHYDKGTFALRPINPEAAFNWYQQAALAGNDTAMYELGQMYVFGRGTAPDSVRAVRWYLKAVANGMPLARYQLSQLGDLMRFVSPYELEYIIYRAEEGDLDAQMRLGRYYLKQNQPAQGIRWLRKASAQGQPEGQVLLAEALLQTNERLESVEQEVVRLLNSALKAKEIEANRVYAQYFFRTADRNPQRNQQQALNYAQAYLKACQQAKAAPHSNVYYVLGEVLLAQGQYKQAVAQFSEFISRYQGEGVPTELIRAYEDRGWANYQSGQYQLAITDLDFALVQLQEYRNDPQVKETYERQKGEVLLRKGLAFRELGNDRMACTLFRQAAEARYPLPEGARDYCQQVQIYIPK